MLLSKLKPQIVVQNVDHRNTESEKKALNEKKFKLRKERKSKPVKKVIQSTNLSV